VCRLCYGANKLSIFIDFSMNCFQELESIDVKPSGQLLELIVKIAEHPDTWEQIHRVLGFNPSL
jgi:hypothetical protein